MVKEFRGEKYLSSTKEQSAIEEIGDIGDVEEEDEEGASGCKQFDDVRVVGVDRLDNCSGRMKCGSKVVVDAEDEDMYEVRYATSNRRLQKTLTAQLRIKNSVGCISLRAFEKCIMDIVQNASEETLLKAKPFNICFKDGVIISIVARRASETPDQKEERIAKRRCKDAARREAKRGPSTPRRECRAGSSTPRRLQQMRAYRANRIASKSVEEREARLEQMRQRFASETDEEREARLDTHTHNHIQGDHIAC